VTVGTGTPGGTQHDLVRSALEAASGEAGRRRSLVRWVLLALALGALAIVLFLTFTC
jgi:hypothetical protein